MVFEKLEAHLSDVGSPLGPLGELPTTSAVGDCASEKRLVGEGRGNLPVFECNLGRSSRGSARVKPLGVLGAEGV